MYKLLIALILLFSETALAGQYENILYQKNDTLEHALSFIGTPKDKIDQFKSIVHGELADKKLISFSNKIIVARETHNVSLFKSLTDQESLRKSTNILNALIGQINDGSLFYGNEDYKYFVTSRPITDDHLKIFLKNNNKPSAIIYFYFYYPLKERLIGSQMFLIETKGGFKNVLPIK